MVLGVATNTSGTEASGSISALLHVGPREVLQAVGLTTLGVQQEQPHLIRDSPAGRSQRPLAGLSSPEAQAYTAVGYIGSVLLGFILLVCIAFLYKNRKGRHELKYQEASDFGEFRTTCIEIFDDLPLCVFSTIFPSIRQADTLSMVKGPDQQSKSPIIAFVAAFCILEGLNILMNGGLFFVGELWAAAPFWICSALILMYFRQKLREAFGMENRSFQAYCEDFWLYACCLCCVVAQDARHVEMAARRKHPAIIV